MFRLASLALLTCLLILPKVFAQTAIDWQQRVRYEMDVTLLADRHQLRGEQRLTYYNNSPDTLREVFYHLYFNAFNPQSMMAERNRQLPDPDPRVVPRIFELDPDEVGHQRVQRLTQDGQPVSFEVYDTVMKVRLATPIPPGDSSVFDMRFETKVPLITRRAGRDSNEGIDYSMAQWYPKMANYDHTGWHADPYIGREFYAPYGTFDVRLTLPSEYVVGGTGVLQNPEEVGHGYGTGAMASSPTASGDSLTWHFHAENVHDFAWAADPEYIHERFTDRLGITYHVLYLPAYAEVWKNQRTWLPALTEFFSSRYGRYPYPQFTVAQAGDGGMEYPMMTFITGNRSPGSLLGTTAHEYAHEWFYGIVGTNEADYAWIDEGLANYISTEALAHINGQQRANHANALLSVMHAQHYGYFEPLDTPSDWFETNSGYGVAAYSGGQSLAEMLGYVISEPLRERWLRKIVDRFLFRHPHPHDLEKVAEDVSGLQLDWFFSQLLNTRWEVDYGIDDMESRPDGEGGWTTTITLKRKGRTVLPVDLVVELENGQYRWVNVPLTIMAGHKPVPEDWLIGEPWPWTFPEHTMTVTLPGRPVRAHLDPFLMTPEMSRLDNQTRLPVNTAFLQPPVQNWQAYSVGYRPLGQYAQGFGFAVGAQTRGTYLFDRLRTKAMLKVWPQVLFGDGKSVRPQFDPIQGEAEDGSAFDGIDYELSFSSPVERFGPFVEASLSSQKHFGFLQNELALQATLGRRPLFRELEQRLRLKVDHRYGTDRRVYSPTAFLPLYPEHTLSAGIGYIAARGEDLVSIEAEFGSNLSESVLGEAATRLLVDAIQTARFGPFKGAAKLRLGLSGRNLMAGRRYRLGVSTALDAWQNDAFRTLGAAFDDAVQEGRFDPLAGVGPAAYALGNPPTGRHILAGRLELSTDGLFSNTWLAPFDVLAYSGIGEAWDGSVTDVFRNDLPLAADAGFGATYDASRLAPLGRWIAQSDVLSTLRLAARFPVWVSKPEYLDETNEFGFRWVIGIETGI